jgi:hypothetical protein
MQHRLAETRNELKYVTHDPAAAASCEHLLEKATVLEQHSQFTGDKPPTPEQALELLTERRALLEAERSLYAANSRAGKALTATVADMGATTGSAFADVPLRLAHLSPLVEGHVYAGSPADIQKAVAVADKSGVPLAREWVPDKRMWR